MSQLRNDLYKRIAERLELWASDSTNLYDMAGIDEEQSVEDVFTVLYLFLMRGAHIMDVDPDEFANCVKGSLEHARRKKETLERK